jgi:hypothetical protein
MTLLSEQKRRMKKSTNIPKTSYDKNEINQCNNSFKKFFLTNQEVDKQNLLKLSMSGDIGNQSIRPMTWQILLNLLPSNENLEEWANIKQKQRTEFKNKLKGLTQLKKFSGDPLGGTHDVITT